MRAVTYTIFSCGYSGDFSYFDPDSLFLRLQAQPSARSPLRSALLSTLMQKYGEYSHDRRDETATPLCGAHRPQADHKNALLIKTQLGTVRATVYDLPSKGNLQHEYGLRQERDGTSSAEVLGNWSASEPNPNIVPGRDFKALNKHAVVSGVTGCKGMADYR